MIILIIMNKTINKLSILVLLFNYLTCYAQKKSGMATYEVIIESNEKVNKSIISANSDSKKLFDFKNVNPTTYSLEFNDSISLFQISTKLANDNNELNSRISSILSGSNKKYLINRKMSLVKKQVDVSGSKIIIVDNKPHKWKLLNDTYSIDGKTYLKAEAVVKEMRTNGKLVDVLVTAWYDPNIPLSLGPYNYYGLPGMIVKLSEKNKIITLKSITFKSRGKKLSEFKKGTIMTESEYNSYMKKKVMENFIKN